MWTCKVLRLTEFWLHFERLASKKPGRNLRSSQPFSNRDSIHFSGPNPRWAFSVRPYVDSFWLDLCKCQQSTLPHRKKRAGKAALVGFFSNSAGLWVRKGRIVILVVFSTDSRAHWSPCFRNVAFVALTRNPFWTFNPQNWSTKKQLDDTRLKTHLISYPVVWYCAFEAFGAVSFSQGHLALDNKKKGVV